VDIPYYPEYKPVERTDKPWFDRAFESEPPVISEFTFTNIYAWRKAYQFKVSLLDDLLILSSKSYGSRVFFNPIGKQNPALAIERILGHGGSFVRVPEKTKALFDKNPRVTITADPDNSDYLYLASELIELAGGKFDGKRNLIKKFKSQYPYQYVTFSPENVQESLAVIQNWCLIKGCDTIEGLDNERSAIKEMVAYFSLFGISGAGIRVKDELCAFIFAEKLNGGTLVVHVLKADARMPGLYQVMLNEFLAREARAFTYVNLEQDLGLEGLRKAKRSYQPVAMIQKYRIASKG